MSGKLPSYEDFIVDDSSLPSVDELIVKNNLPSVDVIIDESNLPSVDELKEENNLPSVDDFIEPPRPEEEIADLINADSADYDFRSVGAGNTAIDTAPCSVEEETDEQQDLTEIIQLINDVRKDIPEIPEIKYYDSELESILEQIKEIPEVRYYDKEIEAVCEQIDNVKEEIKELPEPKYYDEEIDQINQTISNLPEVKYYDQEISNLEESFSELKKFVSDAPNYDDEINSIRDKFNYEIQQFSENVEIKDFDKKVEIDNLKTDLKETTEKIYEELKKSSDQIHEHRLHLKDDDRKLKKQILGQYNLLKENIEKKINEFNTKNIESQNIITGSLKEYFNELQEKISSIPEIKYYDEQIKDLNVKFDIDIKELRDIVNDLKETQKQTLQENLSTEPPSINDEDIITVSDEKYVTHEKLHENYQLFVNRVQQELTSFSGGGSGEVRLEFLDDLDRDSALVDGKFLKYQASTKTFIGASGGGEGSSQNLNEVLTEGNTSSKGMSVGVITATSFSGDGSDLTGLTASQIPTLNQNTSGTSGGLSGSPSVELTNIVGAAASVIGIVTATTFVGALTGNVTGNVSGTSGSTTGNSATATKLATARTIGGVSFDGSANISLPGVDTVGNQDTTGTARGLNGTPNITAGDVVASSLDISGDADIDGTLEADAITVNGTALDTHIAGVTVSNATNATNASGLTGTPNISVGSVSGSSATFTGNVSVGGTLTYEDVTNVDSIGIVTARSGIELGAGSITPIIAIEAATSTTTTTSASNIDTFVAATFRSAQYQIQITQGSNYHVTTLNVLHDGSSVYLNEFGTIRTSASLATFDADIDSGNVRVRATPTTDSSTVFKLTKTLTRV